MTSITIERTELSGTAALWATATVGGDTTTASELMQHHAHEIALGILAVPGEWEKWEDVAKRSLIPTLAPCAKLFDALELLMEAKNELLVFGNADQAAMAVHDEVAEILTPVAKICGEAYKAINRNVHLLGPDIAKTMLLEWEVQPELL
jgi:hypothetical protein